MVEVCLLPGSPRLVRACFVRSKQRFTKLPPLKNDNRAAISAQSQYKIARQLKKNHDQIRFQNEEALDPFFFWTKLGIDTRLPERQSSSRFRASSSFCWLTVRRPNDKVHAGTISRFSERKAEGRHAFQVLRTEGLNGKIGTCLIL